MDRYYTFNVTIAAGVTQANPAVTTITLENTFLVDVEIVIPPGHVGLTGIQIRQSGTTILPWGTGKFLIGNDYRRVFEVNTEIGSRAISIAGFNTDVFPHSWDVRFHIRDRDTTPSVAGSDIAAPLADAVTDPGAPLSQPAPVQPGVTTPNTPVIPGAPPPPALTSSPAAQPANQRSRQQFTLINQ